MGYGWVENFCDMAFMIDGFICFVLSKLMMVRIEYSYPGKFHVGKQKLAFSCSLASLHKKIQLISLIFANFDAENALRGKRAKISEKNTKSEFSHFGSPL